MPLGNMRTLNDWDLLDMAEGLQQPTTIEREMTKRFRQRLEVERALHQHKLALLTQQVKQLVLDAEAAGVVIRIETVPLKPLAMGNYKMVATVEPAQSY